MLVPRTDDILSLAEVPDLGSSGLFRRWSMSEVLAEPTKFEWLIKGLLA